MDFEIPETEAEAERRAADFARTRAAELGRMADLDRAVLRDLLASAERAGAGGGSMAARLAWARASLPLFLSVEATRHMRDLVHRVGSEALSRLVREDRVGAVALAGPAGAGPAALRRAGGGLRLSARKSFVTNGPLADRIAVFAEAEGREVVCLVAPGEEGVEVGRGMDLMGLGGLAVASLTLEDAPVSPDRVLGPLPDRSASARYLRDANLTLATGAAGLLRSALSAASRHALARERDGRPLFSRQEVAFRLAEVLSLAEAAELLCHRAAWMADASDPEADTVVRCAKVFCTESAERAASACLQVMGGEGYRRDNPVERAYRDAKGLALSGTTLEVARMEIADALLARA
ncbi:MAG TPA: acyl-CoA dehydrogenase [Anaeromyxobacteraceae bacterium]|nr:acyl-CoA dehydrogenase [Anaeromyxobacteraceae bacterium]